MHAVRDTTDHLMLRATAGSGKTTTLTEAAWHLHTLKPAVYFAYNKHPVEGVAARLPERVRASTLHAFGRRILCQHRNTQLGINCGMSFLDQVQEGNQGLIRGLSSQAGVLPRRNAV
ncbi:hypothetical protein GCM10008955_32740 [Deinococcus malanensis]|uniref:DNA helicase n=1 Tax=Deinococcus malanensis TaxID=1706855 RepID=A0ABQ2F3J3_9DEIO|nr:AAA family ATPase [Deinococcus malanensis]GGK36299.1 hypothetical protein GCM10008955_32740 [Deinococcus malanensis]